MIAFGPPFPSHGSRALTPEEREAAQKARAVAFLEATAALGVRPGQKLNQDKAEAVIRAWFRVIAYVVDRWGNFRPPNKDDIKWSIKARTLRREVKSGDQWIKTESYGLIDYATTQLATAAKRAGEGDAAAAGQAQRQRRKNEQTKAEDGRHRKLAAQVAARWVHKRVLGAVRDLGLWEMAEHDRGALDLDRRLHAAKAEAELDAVTVEHRALQAIRDHREASETDDGMGWSLATPPRPWFDHNDYTWVEDGTSVRFYGKEGQGRDRVPFVIGRMGDFGIHPLLLRVEYRASDADAVGEGWIAGGVTPPAKPGARPLVEVVTVGSLHRGEQKGVGRRLVHKAVALAKGYGAEFFVVRAITDEGAPFWDRLEATGELKLLRKAGHDRLYTWRQGGSATCVKKTSDISEFGRELYRVLRKNDEAYRILDNDLGGAADWETGGCAILALALLKRFGPRATLWAIRKRKPAGGTWRVQHLLVKVDGWILDGEGATAPGDEQAYLSAFAKRWCEDVKTLTLKPISVKAPIGGIPRWAHTVAKIGAYLDANLGPS